MDQWQKRERHVESMANTHSLKRRKSKGESTSMIAMPRSLDFWRSEKDVVPDEINISTDSLSTLGLQQMEGYEKLESLQKGPMQWADDDDYRGKSKGPDPVSTIAFPGADQSKGNTSAARSPRKDGSRFNSMPSRHKAHSSAQMMQPKRSRYSTIAARPKHTEKMLQDSDSSANTSPESKTTPLRPMSLRQRSMKSLQGIASAFVPAAVRTPYESETESAVATLPANKGKEVEEKRPIRLDQRRLQKAVSLAVEAAQASAQDEKAWKQKKIKKQQQLLLEQGESCRRKGRLSRLPFQREQDKHSDVDADPSKGTMTLQRSRVSDNSSSDDDKTSQITKRPGTLNDDDGIDNYDDDDEDLDEDSLLDDDFSVDLYISSLGYLLAALNPKDAENVGDKHREELKRKLEEALHNLDTEDDKIDSTPDREEVIQWRVERELLLLEQAYNQRRGISPGVSRARQAAQASSQQSQRRSVAGHLTSSAIDLGLSVGAGAFAAAARGVANLLPLLTPDEKQADVASVEESASSQVSTEVKPKDVTVYPAKVSSTSSAEDSHALLTKSQWNLTRTLAQSVASTMYNNLAAVAEERKQLPIMPSNQVAVYEPGMLLPAHQGQEDASDQLIMIAATLARNVKRSPLPSQIRALSSQVVSLITVVDERYSLSKRSADLALRKTGQALYYVRKNDLHVKGLRAVWAIVEASVAAVEAYRDEEEWKGEVTLPARIEDMQVK